MSVVTNPELNNLFWFVSGMSLLWSLRPALTSLFQGEAAHLHTVSLSQVHAGPSWLRVSFSVLTLFRGICLKFGQIAKKDSGRDSCWVIDKKRGYKFDSGEVLFCMCCWPSNFTYTEVSYEYNTTGQCSWKGSCLCLSTIICHGEQQTAHIINNHQFLYCSRSHFGAVEVPLIHFL